MFSLSILGVVLCYTWRLAPIAPRWMSVVATMLVVARCNAGSEDRRMGGLNASAFLPSLTWSTLLTVAAAAAIYVAGSRASISMSR